MVFARTFFNLENALLSFCPFYRAATFGFKSLPDEPMARWFSNDREQYVELHLN